MKKLIIFLAPLLLLLNSCGTDDLNALKRFPDVMTVAAQIDKSYAINSTQEYYYSLAKKKDGWYLVKISFTTGKSIGSELYWSAKDRKYLVLPLLFWKNGATNSESLTQTVSATAYSYDHCIYFGYDNWEEDVVAALGSKNDLDDTLLESLARAYEAQVIAITRPSQLQDANDLGKLSDDDAKDVCDLLDKELATYKKIETHDPDYVMLVGLPKTVISNTYMFGWSELASRGRDAEAAKYLVNDLYDPLVINFVENELMHADSNAIVISNGDVDTYASWYVQEVLGFRKDIAVLNLGLLILPEKMYYWQKKDHFGLSLPEDFYRGKNTDYVYVDQSGNNGYISYADAKSLGDLREAWRTHDAIWFNADHVKIPDDKLKLKFADADTSLMLMRFHSTYLYRSDLAVMDIIASNYPKRPVYSITSITSTQFEFLRDGMRAEGMLSKFDPAFPTTDIYSKIPVNLAKFDSALSTYKFEMGDSKHMQVPDLYSNYFYQFFEVDECYLARGDTAKAIATLDKCVAQLKTDVADPDPTLFLGMEYLKTAQLDKAADYLTRSIAALKTWHADKRHNSGLSRHSDLLDYLITLCGTHHLLDLQKKLADEKFELLSLEK
ncbi:MAG TPA: hypothetical protein VL651_13530 [Bacteroidia bacterium]|jgi:hypothetical protein|nr:hypothetical protein [Bacteroidia bacterium]